MRQAILLTIGAVLITFSVAVVFAQMLQGIIGGKAPEAPTTMEGLVAGWKTTEGSGSSVADTSTSNYSLAVTGATWFGASSPLTNALTYASGSTTYSSTGANYSAFNFNHNQAFSVSFWVLPVEHVETTMIGRLDTDNSYRGWEIEQTGNYGNNEVGLFLISTWTTNAILCKTDNDSLKLNVWNHVVVTYSGNDSNLGVKIYVNASSKNILGFGQYNSLSSTMTNSEPLRIGRRKDGGSPFNGTIGPVYIYNRVLNSTEVSALYNTPYSP